ncbi:MAG: hypothetical protein AUJ55_02235 [Proteobacteria bacterium CG1_02_64_396]|nr:MAG: hypothetical protein AUJ55_02235 [Proteobacteria bacterium CG1_02_64_396]
MYRQLGGGDLLSPEQEVWVRLIASWLGGWGVLPERLGLAPADFARLNQTLLPHADLPESPLATRDAPTLNGAFEYDDLVDLLLSGREGEGIASGWMATVVARGCLGSDHLWQDLGLWSRSDLSTLMNRHFPQVAARNDKDMKWKKFLYRQLCEQEEVLICKSPSCAACADFSVCFGPEE